MPWLLVFGLFALKENRNGAVLCMLIPLVIVWLTYIFVKHLMRLPSSADVELNMVFTGLVGGFMVVFLLVERFRRHNHFVFLLPILFLGMILLSGSITKDTRPMAVVLGTSTLAIWGAFMGAKMSCARNFFISRFLVWEGFCLFLLLILFFTIDVYILCLGKGYSLEKMLSEVMLGGAICSIIYFVGLLPFEILLFNNDFWVKRFEAVFGITVHKETEPSEHEPTGCGKYSDYLIYLEKRDH